MQDTLDCKKCLFLETMLEKDVNILFKIKKKRNVQKVKNHNCFHVTLSTYTFNFLLVECEMKIYFLEKYIAKN